MSRIAKPMKVLSKVEFLGSFNKGLPQEQEPAANHCQYNNISGVWMSVWHDTANEYRFNVMLLFNCFMYWKYGQYPYQRSLGYFVNLWNS